MWSHSFKSSFLLAADPSLAEDEIAGQSSSPSDEVLLEDNLHDTVSLEEDRDVQSFAEDEIEGQSSSPLNEVSVGDDLQDTESLEEVVFNNTSATR